MGAARGLPDKEVEEEEQQQQAGGGGEEQQRQGQEEEEEQQQLAQVFTRRTLSLTATTSTRRMGTSRSRRWPPSRR